MSRSGACALASLLLLAAGPSRAQEPAPRPDPNETITVDINDLELAQVIAMVARYTGKNFMYDDRVRGRVTLISETPVTVAALYRAFESMLKLKGFAAVEGPGGVTQIIPVRDVKESAIDTVPGDLTRPLANRDLFITRLVPLSYVKADTIVNTFRPLVSKDANLIAYSPTNTMILTDTAANIRRLMTILTEIDVKTYQEQIRVFPLDFADASQLAQNLSEIFSENGQGAAAARTARARVRTGAAQAQAQAQAAAAAQAIFGATGQPRFITDERTNSIIVIAPQPAIAEVARLIELLDYKRKGTGRIHVYRLQNADAEEMAQTLSSLQQGGAAARPARGAPGQAAAAAVVAELEGGVQITADAPTNSLIIQASAEGFAAMRDVIEELDLRRPQVMVEALIMEVAVDDSMTLGGGFLYRQLLNRGRPDEGQISVAGSSAALTDNEGNPIVGAASGAFRTAIFGKTITIDGQELPVIQAFITASGLDNDTNIISAPVLLTADNEEAQIVIGQNIPIITSRQIAQDVTALPTQNIERQDVGVTLRVTPQISEGDSVRLDIFQEISEVIPTDSADLGPTTSNRTIENTVFVKDGESVMIGGILSNTQTESEQKVPFLGDIPFLGWLFKSVTDTDRKVNLLVVLTPHVVRDPEDLEKLTVEQREKFRSSAGDALAYGAEEEEARRAALAAGIRLPLDPNPVRRELELHTERYPTETLPELRQREAERERVRREAVERMQQETGGSYHVQVDVFRSSQAAVDLLTQLMEGGYDGTVFARQSGAETLYAVQLGPYVNAEHAERIAREVRAETGLAPLVVLEP